MEVVCHWCGLPSTTPGVSPLLAQDHGNGDEHRPWRRVACVCSYTDQWELYLFFNPASYIGVDGVSELSTIQDCF